MVLTYLSIRCATLPWRSLLERRLVDFKTPFVILTFALELGENYELLIYMRTYMKRKTALTTDISKFNIIEITDSDRIALKHFVIKGNIVEVMEILERIDWFDPNDAYGREVLQIAIDAENYNMVLSLLLDANINRAFCNAVYNGHIELIKYLIKHSVGIAFSIDSVTVAGTALHIVAKPGHLNIVKCLLENGASVNLARHDGARPLHIATQFGHYDVVKVLLQGGASINSVMDYYEVTNSGYGSIRIYEATALHIAAYKGYLNIVKYLLENGALVNLITDAGLTALGVARQYGHLAVIEYLENIESLVAAAEVTADTTEGKASDTGNENQHSASNIILMKTIVIKRLI